VTAAAAPYRGLQFFRQTDAGLFFGRESLTASLVARLDPSRGNQFLAVVGGSGSGKSSIVRAGLIAALRRGEPLADGTSPPSASATWLVRVITPTAQPLVSLASNLSATGQPATAVTAIVDDLRHDAHRICQHLRHLVSPPSKHILLVVDQFEELFTLCQSQADRHLFVDALMAASEPGGPSSVVIALRADFYAHCGQFALLREALQKRQMYIGPMTDDELRRAVIAPAQRGRWDFEPGLVDFLLKEVRHEPGALPLLSHALLETWLRRRGHLMTFGSYEESGGVRGAIAETAERVLQEFAPAQQAIARNVFLRLTELGEGTQETRRRARPLELVLRPEDAPAVEGVLKTLADARLITTTEDSVEVAHEALIREWPTLRGWLEEDRKGLQIHRHLTQAAQEWDRRNRDTGELYRGARLATASEWAEAHASDLNPLERDFLTSSQDSVRAEASEREARRQRELEAAQRAALSERRRAEEQAQSALRLRRGALLLAGLLAVATLLTLVALDARSTAQREAAVNRSLVLAANAQQSFDNGEADLALALALEAIQMDQPPSEAVRTLSTIAQGPGTRAVLRDTGLGIRAVAFDSQARVALSGSCGELDPQGTCLEGELILWDLASGTELRRFEGHADWVDSVAFAPDRRTALSGSRDSTLTLWNVDTGEVIHDSSGHTSGANCVAFHPDGHTALAGSGDGTIILWDAVTGQAIHQLQGHRESVNCIAISADGATALSGSDDASAILWNVSTGDEIRRFQAHDDAVTGVVFGLDGRTMLTTSRDHALRLWDLDTGEMIRSELFPSEPGCLAVAPDGRSVAFNVDHEVRLWDLQLWQERQRLLGHHGAILALAIHAEGRLAISGAADGSLRLWNLQAEAELRRFPTEGTPLIALAIHPDGGSLLAGDMSDQVTLWDIESGEIIRRFEGSAGAVSPGALAVSSNGRHALVGSGDVLGGSGARSLVLWDLATGEQIRVFNGHRGLVRSVAFHPDGHTAMSGSQSMTAPEGDLLLWDLGSGELLQRFDTEKDITSIAFSDDGERALTSSAYFLDLTLWDVVSGQEIRTFEGHSGPVFAVAFSPDERTALSASEDGSIILWDLETGAVIRRYTGHDRGVWGLDISPDGQYVVSSSEDGTVILWEFETGMELRRFSGHAAWVPDVTFDRAGRTVFSVSLDGTLLQWQAADLPLDDLLGWIRGNRHIRDLTPDERLQYRVEP